MSDFNRLIGKLEKQKASFQKLLDVTLPKKVGNAAVNHFRKNFRDGGWNDNGLKKWKKTRREEISSARAEYRYGPLLSRQDHLMKSIHFTPESKKVIVSTDVKYATYHNNGAEIRVTPKMRKFAWAKFFSGAKIAKGDSAKVRKQKAAKAGEEAKGLISLLWETDSCKPTWTRAGIMKPCPVRPNIIFSILNHTNLSGNILTST